MERYARGIDLKADQAFGMSPMHVLAKALAKHLGDCCPGMHRDAA